MTVHGVAGTGRCNPAFSFWLPESCPFTLLAEKEFVQVYGAQFCDLATSSSEHQQKEDPFCWYLIKVPSGSVDHGNKSDSSDDAGEESTDESGDAEDNDSTKNADVQADSIDGSSDGEDDGRSSSSSAEEEDGVQTGGSNAFSYSIIITCPSLGALGPLLESKVCILGI